MKDDFETSKKGWPLAKQKPYGWKIWSMLIMIRFFFPIEASPRLCSGNFCLKNIFTVITNEPFSRMSLQVQPNNGGPQQVINLMNLAGGGQDYTIFDFDGIKKPCDS